MTVWLTKKYFISLALEKKNSKTKKRNGNLFSYTYRIPIYVYNRNDTFFIITDSFIFEMERRNWFKRNPRGIQFIFIEWTQKVTVSRRRRYRRERPPPPPSFVDSFHHYQTPSELILHHALILSNADFLFLLQFFHTHTPYTHAATPPFFSSFPWAIKKIDLKEEKF